MRTILGAAAFFLLILTLVGCGDKDKPINLKDLTKSPYTVNDCDSTMEIKNIESTDITVIIASAYDKPIKYGEAYSIELRGKDGIWYILPQKTDAMSTSIVYELDGDSKEEWGTDISILYDSMSAGTYRIVKKISEQSTVNTYDDFYLAAEFSIMR